MTLFRAMSTSLLVTVMIAFCLLVAFLGWVLGTMLFSFVHHAHSLPSSDFVLLVSNIPGVIYWISPGICGGFGILVLLKRKITEGVFGMVFSALLALGLFCVQVTALLAALTKI